MACPEHLFCPWKIPPATILLGPNLLLVIWQSIYSRTFLYCELINLTNTVNNTRLLALCPGLPRWAGTRKVKPIWILLEQETVSGSAISSTICKYAPCLRQNTPAPHHLVFYGPVALPIAKLTASKHWRHSEIAENTTESETHLSCLFKMKHTFSSNICISFLLWRKLKSTFLFHMLVVGLPITPVKYTREIVGYFRLLCYITELDYIEANYLYTCVLSYLSWQAQQFASVLCHVMTNLACTTCLPAGYMFG